MAIYLILFSLDIRQSQDWDQSEMSLSLSLDIETKKKSQSQYWDHYRRSLGLSLNIETMIINKWVSVSPSQLNLTDLWHLSKNGFKP